MGSRGCADTDPHHVGLKPTTQFSPYFVSDLCAQKSAQCFSGFLPISLHLTCFPTSPLPTQGPFSVEVQVSLPPSLGRPDLRPRRPTSHAPGPLPAPPPARPAFPQLTCVRRCPGARCPRCRPPPAGLPVAISLSDGSPAAQLGTGTSGPRDPGSAGRAGRGRWRERGGDAG